MSLQKRIWQSRIRGLPTDQDVSPAEAESPPAPQPVEEEEVAAEENPTKTQNLPEAFSASSSGSIGVDSKTHSAGMASLSADLTNPITPGMKPGGKTPGGKITTQRWDGEKGKFTQEIQVPWGVMVLADDISLSVGALANIKDNLGGFDKNKDVVSVITKKVCADFYDLVSKVGLKNAASMASGKNPTDDWEGVNNLLPPRGFWNSRPHDGERRNSGDGGGGIPGGGTEEDRDFTEEDYVRDKFNNWLINNYGEQVWEKLGNQQTALNLSRIAGADHWWQQIYDLIFEIPTDWGTIMLMILAWWNDKIGGSVGPGGLEPPSEEQSKIMADKAANSQIGSGEVHYK